MTTLELLSDLQQKGFMLTLRPEGKLAVKPAEKLTDALREQLQQRKVEIPSLLTTLTTPYIKNRGEFIIPFESDPRYQYWKPGGQSLAETLTELNASPDLWRRYVEGYTETR